MTDTTLKSRMLRGDILSGTFLKTPAFQLIEILAMSGMDFVALDAEHAPRWSSAVHEALEGSRMAAPPPDQPAPLTVLLVRDGASPCEQTGER